MEQKGADFEGLEGTALTKARSQSLLAQAEERRAAREAHLFLEVPTWNGDLVAEYKVLGRQELIRMAERAARRFRNGANQNSETTSSNDIDLIVAANVGLHMVDPESGERVPIEDEFGPVGYGRVAKVLDKEDVIKSNADAVRYLMSERTDDGGIEENVMAIGIHANAISKWMRDPSKHGVDLEELLGEL